MPSNGIIAKIVLSDLDLHFLFQMYKICEICLFSYAIGKLKLSINKQYTFKHLQSNDVSPIFSSVNLTYIFNLKCLKYVKFARFRMLPEAKIMTKIQQYTFKHLRSKGINVVFLLRDLDLIFQGKIFFLIFNFNF